MRTAASVAIIPASVGYLFLLQWEMGDGRWELTAAPRFSVFSKVLVYAFDISVVQVRYSIIIIFYFVLYCTVLYGK